MSVVRTCDGKAIKATDCIIKVAITRGNITWRSFALRDWAYKQISAWQPLLPYAKGLSFTFMYLLSCKSQSFSLYSFLFSSFGKHHVVRKDLGTYVQLNMGGMSCYCWHHPWGEYVGRRNYKPLSFYVFSWNVFLMGTRWVLAIIEDYMMVEYVDLPKGSDTWPFLKRRWIVVAKFNKNIVCWFPLEFILYTSMLWWIVTCLWEVYDKSSMIKVLCLNLLLL